MPPSFSGRFSSCGVRRAGAKKARDREVAGAKERESAVEGPTLYLFDQAALEGLHGNPDALGAAIGGFDADALKVRPEFALRDTGHVRADSAALLGLPLTIDDRSLDRTATGDCTNSGHDGFELVKGRE